MYIIPCNCDCPIFEKVHYRKMSGGRDLKDNFAQKDQQLNQMAINIRNIELCYTLLNRTVFQLLMLCLLPLIQLYTNYLA